MLVGLLTTSAWAQTAVAPPPADCATIPDCIAMVSSARRLSDASQLNAALQTYETAYARWASPWLLINIGRMQQKLGLPAQAITTYQRYLDSVTTDEPAVIDDARSFLKQAEQDLASERTKAAMTQRREAPIYKKWWLWTGLGAAVGVAAVITAGVILGTKEVVPNGTPGQVHIDF